VTKAPATLLIAAKGGALGGEVARSRGRASEKRRVWPPAVTWSAWMLVGGAKLNSPATAISSSMSESRSKMFAS
jgi:hypothetical protein